MAEKDFADQKDFSDPNHLEAAQNGVETSRDNPVEEQGLREFLLARHGRVDLHPIPTMSLNDPLNWPSWKKNTWLLLIAFQAMFTLFMSAGLIPGYEVFAADYKISVPKASYLTSVQIVFSGFACLFWNPIAARWGRRPVLLISTLGSCVCNIGGIFADTFGTQITTRILVAIFICPPLSIGSATVAETFFAHERAAKMGVWTLMVTIATSVGPLLMGFVYQYKNVHWIFGIFAVTNFVEFLAYFFLNAESLYHRPSDGTPATSVEKKQNLLSVHRINPEPMSIRSILHPLYVGKYMTILIPTIAYTIVFGYANVAITVEMPQVVGEKFHLDPQSTGLQFISIIIGSVLGEQISGRLSDWFVRYMNAKKSNSSAALHRSETIGGSTSKDPTPRLWLSYIGFLTTAVGLIVWGVETEKAKVGHWTVTPLVGAAIAAFGNQVVTTTLITFAVDCHRSWSAEIGVFINLIRQTWGFIGPFYFPDMFTTLGFGGAGGLMAALVVVVSGGLIAVLQIYETRKWKHGTRSKEYGH